MVVGSSPGPIKGLMRRESIVGLIEFWVTLLGRICFLLLLLNTEILNYLITPLFWLIVVWMMIRVEGLSDSLTTCVPILTFSALSLTVGG